MWPGIARSKPLRLVSAYPILLVVVKVEII